MEKRDRSAGLSDLRKAAKRSSKILVRSLKDSARLPWSDPIEVHRLGKLVLESIEFRRLLLDHRWGPKWSEEEELRRMEQQVWRVLSKLHKVPKNGRTELTRMSKELEQIREVYRASRAGAER